MTFIDELQKGTNRSARTENGAVTNASSLDALLDFFSLAGAMRDRPEDAVQLFQRAYAQDKLGAIRALFYMRDIRGGNGERQLFRNILAYLAKYDSETYVKVLKFIPEYGRYDDLFAGKIDATIAEIVKEQLAKDEKNMEAGESVSLLAKWLPSEHTSSEATSAKAKTLIGLLGLKPSQYRKKVVALRKYIKLLEQKMSANEWSDIEYDKLPSQAQRKHVKAFKRHDGARYTEYLDKAVKGEAKMNASTLYTYEVFDAVASGEIDAANAMWANLPDYTNGKNALVVADVSGSMSGRPMSVSVSLALYFAERNKGSFAGYYMTFSDIPLLQKIAGVTLEDKLNFIQHTNVGYNTNLEAAFDAILAAAKNSNASQDEMPAILYIISDMEFDAQMDDCDETNFESAKKNFEAAGYSLPHVVFWNVNARQNQAPATKFDNAVTLISGLSQSVFRYAVEGKSPLELMNEVLNSERYAPITI